MRATLSVLLLLALAAPAWAQNQPGEDPAKPEAEETDDKAAKKAQEPPAWSMSERDRRRIAKGLGDYIHPPRGKDRDEMLHKFQKLVEKQVDGHSVLEDVPGFVDMANRLRHFNPKIGKKGKVETVSVRPAVHAFPGGIGTVRYHLYLPKNYTDKELYPVLFCLPDNKRWTDGKKYIEDAWVSRSDKIADGYIVVVPYPQAKGDLWTAPKSLARAMITLRHACGTFDVTKKTGGPAADMLRVFIDGEDAAALVAARFPELFAGAVLHGCTGKAGQDEPDLRGGGGIGGLAAYCIYDGKQRPQQLFAESLKAANDTCVIAKSQDVGQLGNAKVIEAWLKKLPTRATQPRTIEYMVLEASFQRCYWINVLEYDGSVKPAAMFTATCDRADNVVRVEVTGITRFELFLNDALVDLNRPLRVVIIEDEKEYDFFKNGNDLVTRDLGLMLEELVGSNHPWRVYPRKLTIDVAKMRAAAAKAAAAAAAKASGDKKAKPGGKDDSPPAAKKG